MDHGSTWLLLFGHIWVNYSAWACDSMGNDYFVLDQDEEN